MTYEDVLIGGLNYEDLMQFFGRTYTFSFLIKFLPKVMHRLKKLKIVKSMHDKFGYVYMYAI